MSGITYIIIPWDGKWKMEPSDTGIWNFPPAGVIYSSGSSPEQLVETGIQVVKGSSGFDRNRGA